MTEVQMREVIEAAAAAGWATAAPDVPFILENEASPSANAFAQLTITSTSGIQRTQGRPGQRKVRRDGWIQVKLWGPVDAGAMGIAALDDAAKRVLEMVSLPSPIAGDDPVTTMAASAGPSGTDGRWFMGLVRVPFYYFETK